MSSIHGLTGLTLQLTKARFATRQGEVLLYFAGVLATAVSAALALTVAAGTWLFFDRWQRPTGLLATLVAEDATMAAVLMFYFVLALIACSLLIPALASLAASAAVLGARGRERRLSALRLLGLSSGDVTRMSLIDSSIQSTIGTVLGGLVYLATAGLWRPLMLQDLPTVLHLPWWLALVVTLSNIGIALVATWWGLRQVRISPLGVARRSIKPALTWLRALVLVIVFGVATVGMSWLNLGREVWGYGIMATIILALILGYSLAGPWFLQVGAAIAYRFPGPASVLAARRISADARATWRRVGGLGFIALMAGYLGTMPLLLNPTGSENVVNFAVATRWDFTKGVIITLAVGLALTATSILITQASAVIERSELSVALYRLGTPRRFHTTVQWLENLGPLIIVSAIGYGLGVALATPMRTLAMSMGYLPDPTGNIVVISVLAAGFLLAALGLVATEPLQSRILATHTRRND